MTISGIVLSLFANGKAQARPPATTPADTDAVRRCALYRNCFPSMDVAYPALVVRDHTVAKWVRAHDVAVHVRTSEELGAVISAGVHPARLTVHADGVLTNELVFCAASLAVGHIVVNSVDQIEILTRAIGRQRRQAVLVRIVDTAANDLSVCTDPHLALRVAASRRLELIGVHHRLPTPLSGEAAEETVTAMVACVSCLRRHHGQIATRLSFAGLMPDHNLAPRGLRAAAEKLESLVEDACARFRYPRPALVVQC